MSETDIDKIISGVSERLMDSGHVLVSAEMAAHALERKKIVDRLLCRAKLTPYEIAKFNLIGTESIKTIKNMVKDGRIADYECFKDAKGRLYITKECIKRLRNEL